MFVTWWVSLPEGIQKLFSATASAGDIKVAHSSPHAEQHVCSEWTGLVTQMQAEIIRVNIGFPQMNHVITLMARFNNQSGNG